MKDGQRVGKQFVKFGTAKMCGRFAAMKAGLAQPRRWLEEA